MPVITCPPSQSGLIAFRLRYAAECEAQAYNFVCAIMFDIYTLTIRSKKLF